MDLNHLAVFVAVAEHHSFSRAAATLGIDRSAASRRVAALEQDLGVQLLIRSTRHVEVSTAGRRLLRDVAPLLTRLEAAVSRLPERSEVPAGELRITAPHDVGVWLLPPVLGGLTAKYDALRPVIQLGNRLVDLEAEGFDVALRVGMTPLKDSSLRSRRLGEIRTAAYASPGWLALHDPPTTVEELDEHPVVGVSGAAAGRLRRRPVVTADDMLMAAELCKHGVGIGVLPTFLAEPLVLAGDLERVVDDIGSGTLYALFPSSRELPPKTTAFRDALVAFLAEPTSAT